MTNSKKENTADALFIEVSENDPFDALELHVRDDSGVSFHVGTVEPEPGRYELRRVDDVE